MTKRRYCLLVVPLTSVVFLVTVSSTLTSSPTLCSSAVPTSSSDETRGLEASAKDTAAEKTYTRSDVTSSDLVALGTDIMQCAEELLSHLNDDELDN